MRNLGRVCQENCWILRVTPITLPVPYVSGIFGTQAVANISGNDRLDPKFQIDRELEDEGNSSWWFQNS